MTSYLFCHMSAVFSEFSFRERILGTALHSSSTLNQADARLAQTLYTSANTMRNLKQYNSSPRYPPVISKRMENPSVAYYYQLHANHGKKKLLPPTISGIGIYVHLVHLQVSRRYLSTSPSVCKRCHAHLSITATAQ